MECLIATFHYISPTIFSKRKLKCDWHSKNGNSCKNNKNRPDWLCNNSVNIKYKLMNYGETRKLVLRSCDRENKDKPIRHRDCLSSAEVNIATRWHRDSPRILFSLQNVQPHPSNSHRRERILRRSGIWPSLTCVHQTFFLTYVFHIGLSRSDYPFFCSQANVTIGVKIFINITAQVAFCYVGIDCL